MKRKKIFKIINIFVLSFILFNINKIPVFAKEKLDYVMCGNTNGIPKPVPQLTTIAYSFLLIGTPLILIAFSIVTLIKALSSSNPDEVNKVKGKVLRKIIIAVIIFLIYPIVKFAVNRISSQDKDKKSFATCMNCFLYYSANNCPTDYKGTGNDVTSNIVVPQDPNLNQGGSNITSNKPSKPGQVTNTNPGLVTGTYHGKNYALYIPETVDRDKPLIVYLHGTYERGLNLSTLKNDAGFYKQITENNAKYNTYILMPQITGNEYWNTEPTMTQVKELIDQIVETYGIDKNRISLWGFSLGANEAPSFIKKYPDYFASSVLISCAHDESNPTYYKNVPVYIFQGDKDTHGAPGASFYNHINNIGGKAYTKKYSNQNHSYFVTRVLNDTQLDSNYSTILEWVLDQKKN
jgi:predicted esterase